jgi:hypothetical protein
MTIIDLAYGGAHGVLVGSILNSVSIRSHS